MAKGETSEWLMNRGHRRSLPHRLERCGYVSIRNAKATDGLWKLKSGRQAIYVKASLTPQERANAAWKFAEANR